MQECQNPKRFEGLVSKCDAELSIQARRILRWESHCSEDCFEFVWQPTQEFLERMAKQKPQFLLCCRSKPFFPNKNEEECVDVDIIGPDYKTAYLGMVVNVKQAISTWTKFARNYLEKAVVCSDALPLEAAKRTFHEYAGRLEKLLVSGSMTILRENIGCFIPVEAEKISRRAAEKGVKKIITALMPGLAGLPVRWAPTEEQEAFERFVEVEAKKRAKPQTKEERIEIFRSDIE